MAMYGNDMADSMGDSGFFSPFMRNASVASSRWQQLLDKMTPHPLPRWLGTLVLALMYGLRVYVVQGFFIVTYGLGIYVLNLFIGFLTPQGMSADVDTDEPVLPTKDSEEFKPFVRKLPEFKVSPRAGCGCGRYAMTLAPPARSACAGRRDALLTGASAAPTPHSHPSSQFWYSISKAFVIASFMTLFPFFDIPVFWPILLMYWLLLVGMTMKKQIKHMLKHKYLPFTTGKKKFTGASKNAK